MNLALAALSAILLVFVFPNPWGAGLWPPVLAMVSLTPLITSAFREKRPLRRFLNGWLAGALFWAGVCYWIQFVLEVHGGMGPYLSWLAFVLFALYKGLHLAVLTWGAGFLPVRAWTPIAIAALFAGLERTHGPLGFAWLNLGNTAIDLPAISTLSTVLGVYGITFLLTLAAAALACRTRASILTAAAILVTAVILAPSRTNPAPADRTAVLLQPNVDEERQWTAGDWTQLSTRLLELSREAASPQVDLIAWPELPAPLYYFEDPDFASRANALARHTQANFLIGSVGRTPKGDPLNSAVLITPEGKLAGQYSKMNLVPFGEFVPPLFAWVNKITKEAGDYAPGTEQTIFNAGSHKLAAFICYESAFPDFVRSFVRDGAEVLVNISNDGYFGHSAAREQHLQLVRMRALENARWILRPTNNGITAAIDPLGRVADRFPSYEQTAGRVRFTYLKQTTLYTRQGDWFAWLCLLGGVISVAVYMNIHHLEVKVASPKQPAN